MKTLFVELLRKWDDLSQQAVYDAICFFLRSNTAMVVDLCVFAVVSGVQLDKFLLSKTLQIFFDYGFLCRGPSLRFVKCVTVLHGEHPEVVRFWMSATTLSGISNAILGGHSSADEFTELILDLAREGQEFLVERMCKYVKWMPCVMRFIQACSGRFSPESNILLELNQCVS
jgi:hypothetical protein